MVERAAQNDSVASGKHIAAAQITIINLRLRQEHYQLAAHRTQFLIVEQRTGAEAGAVEDYRLRQSHNLMAIVKLFHYNFSAGNVEVAQECIQVCLWLDQHGAELPHKRKSKVMIGIT